MAPRRPLRIGWLSLAVALAVSGCGMPPREPAARERSADRALQSDPTLRVELIQAGRAVGLTGGEYRLAAAPFAIRAHFAGRDASVFATTDRSAADQLRRISGKLIAFAGSGAAVSPGDLLVVGEPLELYAGWSAAYSAEWGRIWGPRDRESYLQYRRSLDREPTIIMSGRQYANFVALPTGGQEFPVETVSALHSDFEWTGGARLDLIVFADRQVPDGVPGSVIRVTELGWVVLPVGWTAAPARP